MKKRIRVWIEKENVRKEKSLLKEKENLPLNIPQ